MQLNDTRIQEYGRNDGVHSILHCQEKFYTSFYNFMRRLNSGNNFFVWTFFSFQKLGNDSVNCADSGDINILVQFPGNSILRFFPIFLIAWLALICVGVLISKIFPYLICPGLRKIPGIEPIYALTRSLSDSK